MGFLPLDIYRSISADRALKKMHKTPFPEFKETDSMRESRMRANDMASYGYTPQERAAFDSRLGRSQNDAYSKAMAVAPTLAKAILAGINYTNTGAINDFSARDAALHRDNIRYADKFSQELQRISDSNIEQQIRARLLAEQQLGEASQSWMHSLDELWKQGTDVGAFVLGSKLLK